MRSVARPLQLLSNGQSIKNHKLPIFSGVVLSFSGTTNSGRQTEITRKLKQDDGTYLENLERPVKITHILCSGDEETEKIRYARRFNQRGEANIHLVWEEWFWDSLEFGGKKQPDFIFRTNYSLRSIQRGRIQCRKAKAATTDARRRW